MNKQALRKKIEEYVARHTSKVYGDQEKELRRHGYALVPSKEKYVGSSLSTVEGALVSPSWCNGGMTGGSCYGDLAEEEVWAEDRPTWLEDLVKELFPDISSLKFRQLQKKIVQLEYTEYECYGNYTVIAFEVLRVSDLFEVLDA